MRLIDKDYAVDTAWSIDVYHGSVREVCEMLEDAPTVEMIRCGDCKHYDTQVQQCTYEADWFGIEPNGFCSRAERKEE